MILANVVLICNVIWLIWTYTKHGIDSRYGAVQRGACAQSKSIDSWLHALINILSTAILSASSIFAQTFSSPTRAEIDVAHAKKQWLHIGLLSFRNMRHIAKKKTVVVLILLLTSLPFHLLYNAMVFKSTPLQQYNWAVVEPQFMQGAPWDLTSSNYKSDMSADTIQMYAPIQREAGSYERMNSSFCFDIYPVNTLLGRSDLLVVLNTTSSSNSIHQAGFSSGVGVEGMRWMCELGDCPDLTLWRVLESKYLSPGPNVDHCLSKREEIICTVQFSYDIMIVVLAFNIAKIIAMVYVGGASMWRT